MAVSSVDALQRRLSLVCQRDVQTSRVITLFEGIEQLRKCNFHHRYVPVHTDLQTGSDFVHHTLCEIKSISSAIIVSEHSRDHGFRHTSCVRQILLCPVVLCKIFLDCSYKVRSVAKSYSGALPWRLRCQSGTRRTWLVDYLALRPEVVCLVCVQIAW